MKLPFNASHVHASELSINVWKHIFFDDKIFSPHEIIAKLKNAMKEGGRQKFKANQTAITQIITFI